MLIVCWARLASAVNVYVFPQKYETIQQNATVAGLVNHTARPDATKQVCLVGFGGGRVNCALPYDATGYFNTRAKADRRQLHLQHETGKHNELEIRGKAHAA